MKGCPHCWESQVNHTSYRFQTSSDIIAQRMHSNNLERFMRTMFDPIVYVVLYICHRFFKWIGIIRHNKDIKKITSWRARVLWEEAERRGIKMIDIRPFGLAINLYRAKMKDRDIYYMDMPRPDKFDKNLEWIDDKYLFKKMLAKHKLPHAKGDSFTSLRSAIRYFDTLEKPVIIKPRLWSRSRHTTTGISDIATFKRAFKIAKQLCHRVMIEEHLPWAVYRGTVIWGKLVAVLGGTSPQVTGDGKSTIQELIDTKNKNKQEQQGEIKITDTLKDFLSTMDLSLDSVLPTNKSIKISAKSWVANGGESIDLTDQIHPDTRAMLEEVGRVADSPIMWLDFMITDISKSYKEQKCGIIECNAAPFIQLHHDVMIGKSINVAKYVWDLVDK